MTEALILCGGLGTRLRSVLPDTQKVLAPVGETSFLEFLLAHLNERGFNRFILCAGYHADQVEALASENILISKEETPLGTAGAIKNAEPLIRTENFWVFNGDSFCDFDYAAMTASHKDLITMALVPAHPDSEGGFVQIDDFSRVIGFREKSYSASHSFINAGVYLFSRSVLDHIPEGRSSLETDLFPSLTGRIVGYPVKTEFFDIGTPERLEKFRKRF